VLSRRGFLAGTLSSAAIACGAPRVRSTRPRITHGVQAGDVGGGAATIWARCDEPARLVVEWDTSEKFTNVRRVDGGVTTPVADGTRTVALAGLPDAQTIVYRARFEREAARGASDWVLGRFRTPRSDRVRLVWTGDTCGQGFGRNPEWGGLRGYAALLAADPDVFVNSGDLIYADNPILAEVKQPDGRVWRNITDERVARVAESLEDFRARFAYNFADDHVRALAAGCSVIAQWDDHETHNNWFPGQQLADARYTERSATNLAAHARRALMEWTPIARAEGRSHTPIHRVIHHGPLLDVIVIDLRSFRSPNDANLGDTGAMLGASQARWLVDQLAASQARWKIVASDQPLSLVIPDGADRLRQEGYANGDPGPPLGREREIAAVLAELQARKVRNVAWLTADVHYAAAHHYDPARAQGVAFDPFWEFVAGPIHAGTFGPEQLDPTLGPEVRFQWAPPPGTGNLAPWHGLQSFGAVDITPDALAVSLLGIDGVSRFRVDVPATT
jgi:alkaline phosphatase D